MAVVVTILFTELLFGNSYRRRGIKPYIVLLLHCILLPISSCSGNTSAMAKNLTGIIKFVCNFSKLKNCRRAFEKLERHSDYC